MTDHPSRRRVLGQLAAGAVAAQLPIRALAQTGRTLRIGFVSPQTGPLAAFGEANRWTIDSLRSALAEGVVINGTRHPIEVVLKEDRKSVV